MINLPEMKSKTNVSNVPRKSILFRWSIGLYRNQWFIEQGQRLIMALDLMIASHPIKAKIAFKSYCMLMGKLAVEKRLIKNHTSITSAYGCVTKNCDALKLGLTKIKSSWWHKRRNDTSMLYYVQVYKCTWFIGGRHIRSCVTYICVFHNLPIMLRLHLSFLCFLS